MSVEKLAIHSDWSIEDREYVRRRLAEYNSWNVSEVRSVYEEVSLILKDERGQIYGGITGAVKWNYLKIDFFWIDEKIRKRGYGKKLLTEMEKLAKEKGCDIIEVDTFSFQAPDFYVKNGYEVIGIVENAPRGHKHYYLYKKLK